MLRIAVSTILLAIAAAAQSGQTVPQPVDGTPLLRAKLALELARARALEDRFDDASRALRDAAKALADYENVSPGPHAETAAFIRSEIETYAPRIVRDHADAVDRIDMWLAPVNRWHNDIRK